MGGVALSELSNATPPPSIIVYIFASCSITKSFSLASSLLDLRSSGRTSCHHSQPSHLTSATSHIKTPYYISKHGIALLHKYESCWLQPIETSLTITTDGGACVAMVGKDCVAIACDLRLGMQALTVSNNFPKIFSYGSQVHLGLTGLATDVQTVSELFRYKHNMYRLREERDISPQTFANLVSSSLYERRFGPWFVSPVVAGINGTDGKPFICGYVTSRVADNGMRMS